MRRHIAALIVPVIASGLLFSEDNGSANDQVRAVIQQFEQGLRQRNLSMIEPLAADEIVVFENGHRNDGWADFRDNHLIPEMKEPAAPAESRFVKIKAGADMAWGYTRTEIPITRKNGDKATLLLWSTYVLEKRADNWRIVLLDWSIRQLASSEKQATSGLPAAKAGPGQLWTVEAARKRLVDAGLNVRQDAPVRQPFLSVPGSVLVVGADEAEIQTYIYKDEPARVQDTETLDAKRAAPPTIQVTWRMPVSLLTSRNGAFIILTRDETLRARIAEAMGPGN